MVALDDLHSSTASSKQTEAIAQTNTPDGRRPNLFIATPAYGCLLTTQYLQCILQTQLSLCTKGIGINLDLLGNESLITRARNLLTKRFLLSDATHLLFIDADISWSPEAVLRLLQKDQPVVTGVYPKKMVDWKNVATKLEPGNSKEPVHMMGLDYNINVTERETQVVNGFAKVFDAATGFMLIKREALEQLYSRYQRELFVVNDLPGVNQTVKDYIAVFDCMIDPDTRRYLSEDFAFSRRWQAVGGEVFADLAVPLGHTGSFHYEGDVAQRLNSARGRQRQTEAEQTRAAKEREPVAERQDMPKDKIKVLLALLPNHSDQVSSNFVLSVTRTLAAFAALDKHCVQIKIFPSKNAACDYMWNDEQLNTLVLLDGMLGFEPELVLNMLSSASPFEVGVYPNTQLDWSSVEKEKDEEVQTRGLTYSIALTSADQTVNNKRIEVPVAGLDIAKIDRCVLERINQRLPPQVHYSNGQKCMWFHEGIHEDRAISADELFCRWWGEGVTANLSHGVSRLGGLTFNGSVLYREQLR